MDPTATTRIAAEGSAIPEPPQMVLLDWFFPGFSAFSGAIQRYLHIDINIYIPLVLLCGGLSFAWQSFSEYVWSLTEAYLMSVVDIRTDDEIYNMLMGWVAKQKFASGARRFVVNTNLNSRSWFLYDWNEDYEDDEDGEGTEDHAGRRKKKDLAYTPTFGSHWFWYKGRLLIFRRTQGQTQSGFLSTSEKEEISVSCFGRNPWILKELLHEARLAYMKKDESKTLIYRGTSRSGSTDPTWQRSMSRATRPFSTVILNEKVKKDLIDDVTDYLDPATRRWYSNRGIPYRRGYLLHGPPGTGKSSLSLALAGFFKMRIYIVSLSSVTANEENLASLFAELPRRCVVLLEDIDTAGLTHTREGAVNKDDTTNAPPEEDKVPGQLTPGNGITTTSTSGRLSLSGLLNILDGVASQEGRVLIMTTNHIEKLDKALIRPGRVDMTVKFDRADTEMTAAIFRAIFAPLEGDDAPVVKRPGEKYVDLAATQAAEAAEEKRLTEAAAKKEETLARIEDLARQFAAKIPSKEFSPAEIQGFLLKNKRNPEAAVEGAEQWMLDARKEKREKELKEAEEKKKAEEKAKKEKEEEAKKKEEEETKRKEEEVKKKEEEEDGKKKKSSKKEPKRKSKKSRRKSSKKAKDDDSSSDSSDSSSSSSDSDSDSEAEKSSSKKRSKCKATEEKKVGDEKAAVETKPVPVVVVVAPPPEVKVEPGKNAESKAEVQIKAPDEDGKLQGVDSGYGTP
ncbi:BCS1 N terminal-domain-containing protein [Lasiosphaeris hirsuta]|uniref:BCS1 N terminal-domain-containing protein n=1 Tax=Lasiosphaeris hirsuta TaxID=260670 RepID=A0AA40A2R6_9PEZI|nr:BCS1 N terminal-domain-containing protein [Lasiosphaeris hirsuta]